MYIVSLTHTKNEIKFYHCNRLFLCRCVTCGGLLKLTMRVWTFVLLLM